MRILIAEDDVTSRAMLAAVLKKAGHEVVQTSNGAEAWARLQEPEAPSLAILDWMMPGMDGVEVVRRVRTLDNEQPPYLIMLTSKSAKADIIAGLNAGADDYLAKPFDVGELHARVRVGMRMLHMQAALIESRKAFAHQATHDPLTGLLNRRAILDCLGRELSRVERHDGGLAVGMCDIDHFKQVNDTHGHQTGDMVLCELSQILRTSFRSYDSVGRMGGEEFLVVAPMKVAMDPMSLFERVCVQVAESRIKSRWGELSITVSIGVAIATRGITVDAILGAADDALYRAKAQGRNRVVCAAGLKLADQMLSA